MFCFQFLNFLFSQPLSYFLPLHSFFCFIYLSHHHCCWHIHRLSCICSSSHVFMQLISFYHSKPKDSYFPAIAFFCMYSVIQSSSSLWCKINYKIVAKSMKRKNPTKLQRTQLLLGFARRQGLILCGVTIIILFWTVTKDNVRWKHYRNVKKHLKKDIKESNEKCELSLLNNCVI